ncbi:MAG: hypothetical protein ISR95_08955, partial [Candidatus Marinimicrobia bacterium]|nr:hypothetical protein [Candidatus Neomarinimicrobiota bacterium]
MQKNIIILIIILCLISLSDTQEVEIDTANLFEEEFIIPEGEMDMEEIIMEDFPLEPMKDTSVSTGIPIPGFEFVEPEELDTVTAVEFIDTTGLPEDTT